MVVKLATLAAIVVSVSSLSALADTQRVAAVSGKPTLVGVSGDIDPATCKTADVVTNRFSVMRLPQNGSVSTGLQEICYKAADSASPCNGKRYLANVLFYTPKRGFKGTDSFSIGHAVSIRDFEMLVPVLIEIDVR